MMREMIDGAMRYFLDNVTYFIEDKPKRKKYFSAGGTRVWLKKFLEPAMFYHLAVLI